jgi:hypothetical protein
LTQVLLLVQVFARIVEVVLVVLSLSVAVAQSKVTVSGQVTLYQKLSVPEPLGTVNVWLMELSPLVGVFAPASPEKLPEWAVLLIEVVPVTVQPEKLPVSKPPLVMPPPPPEDVTVTVTVVLCVALPSVPVTVTV